MGKQAEKTARNGYTWVWVLLVLLLLAVGAFLLMKYFSHSDMITAHEREIASQKQDISSLNYQLEQATQQAQDASDTIGDLNRTITKLKKDTTDDVGAVRDELLVEQQKRQECIGQLAACEKQQRQNKTMSNNLAATQEKVKQLEAELKAGAMVSTTTKLEKDTNAEVEDLWQELRSEEHERMVCLGKMMDCQDRLFQYETMEEDLGAAQKKVKQLKVELMASARVRRDAFQARLQEYITSSLQEAALVQLQTKLADCEAAMKKAQSRLTEAEKLANATNTYQALIDGLEKEIAEKDVVIERFEGKVKIDIVGKILFPFGSSKITPKGKQLLTKLNGGFEKLNGLQVYVIGHTDDVAIRYPYNKKFPTNWELSSARASSVARFLIQKAGISPKDVAALGRAEFQPAASNATAQGRAQNRRVEIVIGESLRLNE